MGIWVYFHIKYRFTFITDAIKNTYMNIRSKAPLRLGIAGGGTDVSPYSDTYGGCVLNASINMYSYTFIKNTESNSIEFSAEDIERHPAVIEVLNVYGVNDTTDL